MAQILNLIQGSAEWLAERLVSRTASEAPAMMGLSKYMTRDELLQMKKTGLSKEVNQFQQAKFDEGHSTEDQARIILEQELGIDFYPVVLKEGKYLASMDGVDELGTVGFEHKLWNEEFAANIRSGIVPDTHWPQLEQQIALSGVKKIIFVCSDGTREKRVMLDYFPISGRWEQIQAGWAQFDADLENYTPKPEAAPIIGKTLDSLPALRIEVSGMVTASNLEIFKEHALTVFRGIKTDLEVDQDFADAEKTVKWCKDVEERLEAAKQHALSQTASIDELFRAIDAISSEAKNKRLELDKLVKARKEAIRLKIVTQAMQALKSHYDSVNATLGDHLISWPNNAASSFNEAIKGKRTISSLQDAVDTTLAAMKIEANQKADQRRLSVAALEKESVGFEHLFADRLTLCATKAPDDIRNLVASRINGFKARQAEQAAIAQAAAEPAQTSKAEPQALPPHKPTKRIEQPEPVNTRPTNEQLLMAVADLFTVTEDVAYQWLIEFADQAQEAA